MEAKDRIILPLDVDTVEKALALVRPLSPVVGYFKLGLQFINALLVSMIAPAEKEAAQLNLWNIGELFALLDGKIFWDGKFCDIPNTVKGAAVEVTKLRVKMFNVHASAGIEAMMAAVASKGDSLVLAVTVLTSLEENNAHLIFGGPSKAKVLQLARDAKIAGCDGIICSPQELVLLAKQPELKGLLKVTPGIRAADAPPDDQKRTLTPAEAIKAKADYLVIGRPITGAPDLVAAAVAIAAEIATAEEEMRTA